MNRPSIYEYALKNNIVITEYGEYLSILELIEQNIRIHRKFVVDITYMKKILGPDYRKKHDDAIYDSLRRILKKYDIDVRIKSKSGITRLIMYPLAK